MSSENGDLWALGSVIPPHIESVLTTLTRKLSSRSYTPEDNLGPFSPQSLQVPGSQRTRKNKEWTLAIEYVNQSIMFAFVLLLNQGTC